MKKTILIALLFAVGLNAVLAQTDNNFVIGEKVSFESKILGCLPSSGLQLFRDKLSGTLFA